MKQANNGQARAGGFKGVVVPHLTGQIKIDLLGDRFVEQLSAGSRAHGRSGYVAIGRTRYKEMIDAKLLLDPLKHLLPRRRRH